MLQTLTALQIYIAHNLCAQDAVCGILCVSAFNIAVINGRLRLCAHPVFRRAVVVQFRRLSFFYTIHVFLLLKIEPILKPNKKLLNLYLQVL